MCASILSSKSGRSTESRLFLSLLSRESLRPTFDSLLACPGFLDERLFLRKIFSIKSPMSSGLSNTSGVSTESREADRLATWVSVSNPFFKARFGKGIPPKAVWAYEIAASNAINKTLILYIKINYM